MKTTIERFYGAFSRRDAETMAAQYTDDVRFSDPAFGELEGEHARNMWRMLLSPATDLEVTLAAAGDDHARWEARYTFSQTGRQVHNIIRARFQFRDGKICRHDDVFDFWRWSRQALGPVGALLGWAPPLRRSVRAKALKGLHAFEEKRRAAA